MRTVSTASCVRALLASALLLGIASRPAQAELQKKDVTYDYEGTPMKGYLVWDDSIQGKRPGVLVVHEWWGLNDYARSRAEQLAKLGYVAFAVDMFGEGKVTEHPTQAQEWSGTVRSNKQKWRERGIAGLEVLKKQPQVDPDQLAAIGYCFGGTTVLQMAYAGAPLKGVVSFHGGLMPPDADVSVKPRVLICTGGNDSFIPAEQINQFAFGMEAAKANYTIMVFGGARHGFTNPDAARYGIDNIAYDKAADEQSWANMKLFFNELFPNHPARD
jgi:dienelactone hydrolase